MMRGCFRINSSAGWRSKMATVVGRDGRLARVRMADGSVQIMPDALVPVDAAEELAEESPISPIEQILQRASEKIKARRPRIGIPDPTELTAIGLFRMAALSRVRRSRAQRWARGGDE